MADINELSQLFNGRNRNVDLPANTPVVLSIKIGGVTNTELTKAILDNLLALQNGSDFATGTNAHTHDGRYFTETELGADSGTTGSDRIGDDDDYTNFTPTAATVKGALEGIDAALATAGGTEFSDATFRIEDDVDDTKKIAFQAFGISAATTRTITMPDADVNLGDISAQAQDIADLVTLSGVAANATDLGTFTGITIPDNSDIKEALQALETNVEGKANTALSNLSSTAVNTDILPDSTGTRDLGSPSLAFQEVWSSQFIVPGGVNGFVGTALRTGSGSSNLIVLSTGATVDGTSGELITRSGDVSGSTGNSGNAALRSGNLTAADASGSTGIVIVRSGNVSGVSSTGSSGNVVIRSGDTVDGNSGSIFINTTQPTGTGTRGSVAIVGLGLSLDGGASGISVNSNVIGNLANPVLAQDAATKIYVDNAIEGVKPKEAVRAATTVAGTLNTDFDNGKTVDGVTLVTGDRILIKNQANTAENGIYVVQASGAPVRATDFDELSPINEIKGSYVAAMAGTDNIGKVFVCNSNPVTLGTDPITFVYFNSMTAIDAGDGIDLTGTTLSVDHDGEGLGFSSGQLVLELDGSTLSKSGSGLKVASDGITANELAASVAGDGLTGGGGVALAVGNTDESVNVTADAISVNYAPSLEMNMVAGETFEADTTHAVRLALSSETAGRVYKAESDTAGDEYFYVIGVVSPVSSVSAGQAIRVKVLGLQVQGSSDTPFDSGDVGRPVFLGSSGQLTTTPPSSSGNAIVRVGVVRTTVTFMVQPSVVGIN